MPAPPRPKNEAERLALLQSYGILDSEPESGFEDIARLASLICGVPIALVSLVDEDRQWFKARVGLPVQQTSREASFCAHAIVSPRQPLIVSDALADARFVDNPLVTGVPNIRFYAGIPLVLEDGHALGTLCVIDHVPRELSQNQLESLRLLARQVTNEMHLRRRGRSPGGGEHGVSTYALSLDGGAVAGRYRIEEVLGVGGMGLVVGATDLVDDSPVAIKFILPGMASGAVTARFIREARSLIRVRSPHVTRILDVGNLGNGAPFIVMERLEGEDLDDVIEARAPLSTLEAVEYLLQACSGVAHIHAAGILHRDLKPSNLFLVRTPGGSPFLKVLDFGVAKLWQADDDSEPLAGQTGSTLLGSPHYMPPEQMTIGASLDVRSDVWSLGVVLFELLTYYRPFEAESSAEICRKVLHDEPASLSRLRPGIPAAMEQILGRCLAKDRGDRYASVTELASALATVRAKLVAR